MPNLGWFKIALTLILLTLLSAAGTAETLRFAAMGDLPYRSSERLNMPRWLTEISATQPAFILHVGDFKGSREECSDANFMGRYHLFNAASRPFIYTPGDNEWSDCDQRLAGGFDPVERLNKLRQIFFFATNR